MGGQSSGKTSFKGRCSGIGRNQLALSSAVVFVCEFAALTDRVSPAQDDVETSHSKRLDASKKVRLGVFEAATTPSVYLCRLNCNFHFNLPQSVFS